MDAVRSGGLAVASVEIAPDGTIRLSTAEAISGTVRKDEFEKWEERL